MLPHDTEIERSLLGELMLSKDAIDDVAGFLKGAHFWEPRHETVYAAILALYGRGEPADPFTVGAELAKSGDLTRIGDSPYLFTLTQSALTAANAEYHAEIVRDLALLRQVIAVGGSITAMGHAREGSAAEIMDR